MSATLRKQIRQQRLSLTSYQRRLASHKACRQLGKLTTNCRIKKQANIAIFVDAFGEMPTQGIIDWAIKQKFNVFLPVVTHSHQPLTFIKFNHKNFNTARFIKHQLGMKQPAKGKLFSAKKMDLMFLPLVALDKNGQRLGMGGGFYDKTLAKCKQKPIKIGWAYDFQLVEKLNTNHWDIGLDMAILPSGLYRF